jgi:hypothetical protein
MQGQATTSGQEVLQQRSKEHRKKRTILLEVNSRDRNSKSFPNSNQFRWILPTPLKDIYSVQLVGGTIPASAYNIYEPWNQFTFMEGSQKWVVSLTPARYTPLTLVSHIQTKLNALAGRINTYTVSLLNDFVSILRNVSDITSFALVFDQGPKDLYENGVLRQMGNPARVLGFLQETVSDFAGTITGPFALDLVYLTSRLYVFLNADSSQNMGCIERSAGKKNPFTIVYFDSVEGREAYKNFTKEMFQPTYYSHPAPIGRVNSLYVSVTDEMENQIPLGSRDLTLLLEITFFE